MNKSEQTRYLKQCLNTLTQASRRVRYNLPEIEEAPKTVRDAQARIEKSQRVVDRWEQTQRKKAKKLAERMRADLAQLRRSFAFADPRETLKLWDRIVRKYPSLQERE